jgi:Condensation domain
MHSSGEFLTNGDAERLTDSAASEPSAAGAGPVRKLGALEQMWFLFGQLHPEHFLLAAEFDVALTEDQVRSALAAVQQRHPLLQVGIDDTAAEGPVFRRPDKPAAISLRVVPKSASGDWTDVAADEFTTPFNPASAPLARAVLITAEDSSVLMLAFDHIVCDGVSAARVLDELVAVLNGARLSRLPVPPSHEELVDRTLGQVDPAILAGLPDPEERMRAWPHYLPFGTVRPAVATLELDQTTTSELVRLCRAMDTTVHSFLVAAFVQARSQLKGEKFIRVLSAIDTRGLLSAEPSTSISITNARTGYDTTTHESLWIRARNTNTQVKEAASASAIAVGGAVVRNIVTPDTTPAAVEAFMNTQLNYEMHVSNLRILELADSGPVRPTAIWGPMLLLQIDGETNAGVNTYDGRLRVTLSSHSPSDDLLAEVRRVIAEAMTSGARI